MGMVSPESLEPACVLVRFMITKLSYLKLNKTRRFITRLAAAKKTADGLAGRQEKGNVMTSLGPTRIRTQTAPPTAGPAVVLVGALTGVLVWAALFQESLTPHALLSASSLLLFALAAAVALIAWRRPMPHRQFSYWDAAGALTFIGLCVAAAVEPERMIEIVAGTDRHP
jgi:hypothetical protein